MKLTISTKSLKNALVLSSHFTSSRQQLPILGNVYLKATKTNLLISATNLESSVSINLAAKIESEGEITIPSKTLVDIISGLSSDSIELELDKEHLKLNSGSFKSNILGVNASDFPKVPDSLNKESFLVKVDDFKEVVEKTIFAVSNDETRPILTGLLFEPNSEDYVNIVGTDGFRLSTKVLKVKDLKEFERIVVPKSILFEIIKAEGSDEIKVEINKENGQIIFLTGDVVFSSRIIEGEYPPYQKIIPSGFSLKTILDKEELLKAVKLASVFSRDSGNVVKIKIEKEKMAVIAESSNSGSQETELEVKTETDSSNDTNLLIQFNYRFMEDVLKSVESDEVVIEFNGQDKAGKFLDSKDKDFLHLIMPIKMN